MPAYLKIRGEFVLHLRSDSHLFEKKVSAWHVKCEIFLVYLPCKDMFTLLFGARVWPLDLWVSLVLCPNLGHCHALFCWYGLGFQVLHFCARSPCDTTESIF